jgi:hypothetical protein
LRFVVDGEGGLSLQGLIVVLGSPNAEDGELYSVARQRCEQALAEYARRRALAKSAQRHRWKFLLTGGYGEHFNTTDKPHAAYLMRYLVERGVPHDAFVEFAESGNTLEDASLAKPIVQRYEVFEIVVVTSDFHLDRARVIFEREFSDTNVRITFSVCKTDEQTYEFDLEAQKQHERKSLARLRKSGDVPIPLSNRRTQ